MSAAFRSPTECRTVLDRVFSAMDSDPAVGPRLREAGVSQRFAFTDMDLVVNVRAAEPGEDANVVWAWTDDVPWTSQVRLSMSSETANRFFQGKENVGMAFMRRKIRVDGDVKAVLALAPIIRPVFDRYRDLVAVEYPHLMA